MGGCAVFPANNYWNRDISRLPVSPHSRQWLSHMSTSRKLHPDFGPSYGDGPNYGIPITVVSNDASQGAGQVRLRQREQPGRLPVRRRHRDRGRSQLRWRHARGRRTEGDVQALRDLEHPRARRALGCRLGRGLVAEVQRAAPRHLDLGRRRRAADPARAAALERGEGGSGAARDPVHHRRHQPAPPLAGPPRRRLAEQPRLPADGCPVPAEGVVLARRGTTPTPVASSTR